MAKGEEPAFPTNRAGHSPEQGLSIRDYVSIEILKSLLSTNKDNAQRLCLDWWVRKAYEATDLWLAEREKRTAPKPQ